MSQPELLKKVIATLEQAEIEYMPGSVVSSLQGEPRSISYYPGNYGIII
jgi:hypothetical protein